MKANFQRRPSQAFRDAFACALVLAVGLAAYSNSFSSPFVLDDLDEISHNPHIRVRQLDGASLSNAGWHSPSPRRPVANVTLALNYYLGQYNVFGYHVANLAIHLACGMLVYQFAKTTLSGTLLTTALPMNPHGC